MTYIRVNRGYSQLYSTMKLYLNKCAQRDDLFLKVPVLNIYLRFSSVQLFT